LEIERENRRKIHIESQLAEIARTYITS